MYHQEVWTEELDTPCSSPGISLQLLTSNPVLHLDANYNTYKGILYEKGDRLIVS